MKYERFEDLPVWKASIELAERTLALTRGPSLRRRWGVRDQVERSVISISCNVAEGFERGTTKELINFLFIALGSSGELRSLTYILERLVQSPEELDHLRMVRRGAEAISRQLYGWASTLRNSPLAGKR